MAKYMAYLLTFIKNLRIIVLCMIDYLPTFYRVGLVSTSYYSVVSGQFVVVAQKDMFPGPPLKKNVVAILV